jgi:hypothetical protein
VRHKKGINQAPSETKSPVCVYTHTAYGGWCIGGPPRSHLIVQCALTSHTNSDQKADKSKADKSKVKEKPDGSSLEESSKTKADASKADKRSRPKVNESEADNDKSDKTFLQEDPCRVGPSDFTPGQRPSGFSSVIPSQSTTSPKALTPSQLLKIRKYEKALENQNPSNMYPSGNLGRSTTSNQQIKWWLDNKGEEKPGVTPANNYLAKKPVRTHIYSREEIEAYTEEKLRYIGGDVTPLD